MENKGEVLWVDDDLAQVQESAEFLRDHGLKVTLFRNPTQCAEYISRTNGTSKVILVDAIMPGFRSITVPVDGGSERIPTLKGQNAGQILARWVKRNYQNIAVVGVSAVQRPEVNQWFATVCDGMFSKWETRSDRFLRYVERLAGTGTLPKAFIVHGHDDAAKYELKNFLQNRLGFAEPIILHEQVSMGKTIIEKFEQYSDSVDIAFVLLTPDDRWESGTIPDTAKRRARQNVIFELGFFFGRWGRTSGRVFLLYKGNLELPSDIAGVVYIDISEGIEAASSKLRDEVAEALAAKSAG